MYQEISDELYAQQSQNSLNTFFSYFVSLGLYFI
jgi:hypothetical protein